ncbi:ATP-binding protein [Hymenobacter negativus]|uniref:HAMP domain-containing histidine kinase n=1 Tax=Hymenobacter negativus TaxID=2795026 RepID=A0ABS3QEZ6_9BACT|nr:ATP-binding protein [Hymenobacter negativus]MBO2009827.1 HAMP domain-containing histidine kinase [Hymenobacter negativus]
MPVIEDVQQDLQPLLAETGGQLQVNVAECPTLVVSEKNLRSILYNLVSNTEGSGIGLYMVKKMVENAGGTISAQSRPDQESVFKALFPA